MPQESQGDSAVDVSLGGFGPSKCQAACLSSRVVLRGAEKGPGRQ